MEEMVTISKKEYELLKRHQKEYGILLDVLAEEENHLKVVEQQAKIAFRDKESIALITIRIMLNKIANNFKKGIKENVN